MARIASILFYIVIAAVTILLAAQVKNEYGSQPQVNTRRVWWNRIALAGIFAVLFLCSALRYGIGNDYVSYVMTAHEAYVGGYVVTEPGFNWLVRIVYTLFSGEYYEIMFALFAAVTLFLFLKAFYDQSCDFTVSFFIFMMLGMYFQTYNTVRYYLALAVALYAMRYVLQRDWLKFIAWIVFAAFFHKSVLLVIPVYWISSYLWKKWQVAGIVIISIICYFMKDMVLQVALWLYPSYENTIYLEGGTSTISILRSVAVLAFYLWYCLRYPRGEEERREERFYAQLTLLSGVVSIFFSFLPVVTRIAYYMSASQLFLIPLVIKKIPDKAVQARVRGLIIIAYAIYFLLFLYTAHQPGVGLLPYQSWLFQEERLYVK